MRRARGCLPNLYPERMLWEYSVEVFDREFYGRIREVFAVDMCTCPVFMYGYGGSVFSPNPEEVCYTLEEKHVVVIMG